MYDQGSFSSARGSHEVDAVNGCLIKSQAVFFSQTIIGAQDIFDNSHALLHNIAPPVISRSSYRSVL
jgi:hypothetical protein